MQAPLRKTISSTAIYTIGVLMSNVTSLITLPINTRYLTPSDYGTVEILSMILDVASIVFGLRIDQGLARYYFSYDDEAQRNRVVSTVFLLSLALTTIGASLLWVFSGSLAEIFLHERSGAQYLAIFAITMISPCIVQIPMTVMRLRAKPMNFLAMSATKLGIQVSLNLLLVAHYHMGLLGVIYSTVATQLTLGSVFSGLLLYRSGAAFDLSIGRRLISFSTPLIFSSLASFYLAFGDRFFLNRYWGLAEVGLYGLAYKFGFAFAGLSYGPFQKAWDAEKYEVLKREDARGHFSLVFGLVTKIMMVGATSLSILSPELLRVASGPNFWSAAKIVPIIVFAYLFKAFGDFASFGLYVKERTKKIAYISWITVVIMTIGYAILIPIHGGAGAAIATLIGFVAEMALLSRAATQCYDMGLEWDRVAIGIAISVAAIIIGAFLPASTTLGVVAKLALIVTAAVAIFLSPSSSQRERASLAGLIRNGITSLRRGSDRLQS